MRKVYRVTAHCKYDSPDHLLMTTDFKKAKELYDKIVNDIQKDESDLYWVDSIKIMEYDLDTDDYRTHSSFLPKYK